MTELSEYVREEDLPAPGRLTGLQRRVLGMVVAGESNLAIAPKVGLNERTIRRWRETPAFANEVRRAVAEIHHRQRLRAREWVDGALQRLGEVATGGRRDVDGNLLEHIRPGESTAAARVLLEMSGHLGKALPEEPVINTIDADPATLLEELKRALEEAEAHARTRDVVRSG